MNKLNIIKINPEINNAVLAANDCVAENKTLAQSVSAVLQNYFSLLEGEVPVDLYQQVLNEVEPALLEKTLIYTRGNQTKTALILGLSRGTLQKKLKQYFLKGCYWRNKRPHDMPMERGQWSLMTDRRRKIKKLHKKYNEGAVKIKYLLIVNYK